MQSSLKTSRFSHYPFPKRNMFVAIEQVLSSIVKESKKHHTAVSTSINRWKYLIPIAGLRFYETKTWYSFLPCMRQV
ncbi:MAG: hypothetical protein M3Z01_05845 [Thermoproteota archaeon]|nr:hypothetical protein [Thermoproteota archaeon]